MHAEEVAYKLLRSPETNPSRFLPQPVSQLLPVLGDLRFRALMSEVEWNSLPLSIRRRFSKQLAGGATAVYAGEVLETWMSRAGWWLAQAARLVGGPLPLTRSTHVPSVVTVTEDRRSGGQIWTPFMRSAAASRRSCTAPSASPVPPNSKNMSGAASA